MKSLIVFLTFVIVGLTALAVHDPFEAERQKCLEMNGVWARGYQNGKYSSTDSICIKSSAIINLKDTP